MKVERIKTVNIAALTFAMDNWDNLHKIETKLKEILRFKDFVDKYHIKVKIDRDGLYSSYEDRFIIDLTLKNSLYTAHILSGGVKIENELHDWIPRKYGFYVDIELNEEK